MVPARYVRFVLAVALSATTLDVACAQAKPAPAPAEQEADDDPVPTPLAVGAMQIASDANLVIEAAGVTVSLDQIEYAYRLKNKGTTALTLAASVTMPDLETSDDGKAIYELPAPAPDNPVSLAVKADQKPVATTASIAAMALGIDRIADLKAEHIPLVPFAADTDKALAAAKPETLTKLAGLGLVSPRDPAQPDVTVAADWSLHVAQGWTQRLEPGASTAVSVSFTPIKATYTADKETITAFDDLKDQICLTPKMSASLKAMLKTKTATLDVTDLILATDKPARWTDGPAMTVQVRKPKPTSIVVFCGLDPASAGQPVVKGAIGEDGESGGLRIMVFHARNALSVGGFRAMGDAAFGTDRQ